MSRIFDALQQSRLEGAGFGFPLLSSLSAEVPHATEEETCEFNTSDVLQLQSLPISVSPESRLVCLTDQGSLAAEKFRFLGVRLRHLRQARPLKKVLITSTIPEEGKSMVSANLAINLAQRRPQTVLLLEGDLRRPSLSTRLGLRQLPGLSEWLQSDRGPMANIYHLKEAGFWFLPAGSPPEDPLELLQYGKLSELLDQLSARFEWILIDSPPVLPLADTSVWMRFADGVLVVAREGKTEKRQLHRGLQVLDRSNLLGVVLNSCASADHSSYYQRYHSFAPRSSG